MPQAETFPSPRQERPEASVEAGAHFAIPGFETLSAERQQQFLRIPAAVLDQARPLIEAEIAAMRPVDQQEHEGHAVSGAGRAERASATSHETQANTAIDTFRRAERGDAKAQRDLKDHAKELLDEELDEEDVLTTLLKTSSSDPFAQDMALEIILSDAEAREAQRVFDLFKDFRGDLPSVDDALKPRQQLDLFVHLTSGQGDLPQRHIFARTALETLIDGHDNLFEALTAHGILKSGELAEDAITAFCQSLKDTPEQDTRAEI